MSQARGNTQMTSALHGDGVPRKYLHLILSFLDMRVLISCKNGHQKVKEFCGCNLNVALCRQTLSFPLPATPRDPSRASFQLLIVSHRVVKPKRCVVAHVVLLLLRLLLRGRVVRVIFNQIASPCSSSDWALMLKIFFAKVGTEGNS